MLVRLNGELREIPDGTTIAGLLRLLGVKPARVAVVLNDAVVVRGKHDQQVVTAGDAVEIVAVMGGV